MINFIRRLFCFGRHQWEYSETHNVKECRKCGYDTAAAHRHN